MDYDNSLDDLDTGIAVPGPFLDWHALAAREGLIRPGTWSLRETGGQSEPFELKSFVFDWPTSKTGWKEDTGGVKGVSPRKQWNASRKKFEPVPTGGKWKKAMQVQVAWVPDQRALWEQNGFGAYVSFVDILRLIMATAAAELPKLPLMAWTGKRQIKTGAGPTLVAVFALERYVPPPACLIEARALMAPAAAPAVAAPRQAADPWAAPAHVTAPPAQVSANRHEAINREVPIEAHPRDAGGGDLIDEIPFGPEVR